MSGEAQAAITQGGAPNDAAQAEIVEEFQLFDDWAERYRYIIDLGRDLDQLDEVERTDDRLIRGCQSRVWLVYERNGDRLVFRAATDAAIVAGLIALLLRVYDGLTPEDILATKPWFIEKIGLQDHLSPTRSNGLHAMLAKIEEVARRAAGMTGDAMRQLYSDRIMALANDIPRQERLDAPDATVERRSPLCGSRITVDVKMDGDTVTDYGQAVRACTLGQASASIMARRVIGADAATLRRVAEAVRVMLKEGGAPPDDLWPELAYLQPAHGYKSRHGSVLLAFEAVEQAVNTILAEQEPAVG